MFSSIDSAKKFAKRLCRALQEAGIETKLSTCHRITAVICQYKDWHHLHTALPHHPHHPNRAIVVERLQKEFVDLGTSLDAETLLNHLVPELPYDLIQHANGTALLERYGQDAHVASLLSDGQPGVIEIRHGNIGVIVKRLTFRSHLPVFVTSRLGDTSGSDRDRINHPVFRQVLNRPPESWFGESYRQLCRTLGFDPDWKRPAYRDDHLADTLIRAAQLIRWPSGLIGRQPSTFEMLLTALDVISTDGRRPAAEKVRYGRRYARYVFHDGPRPQGYGPEPEPGLIVEELTAHQLTEAVGIAVDILLSLDSTTPLDTNSSFCAPFHFLPGEYGVGCQPSLYGWPGEPIWTERYGHLRGVALRPDLDIDDLVALAAMQKLEEQGVRFFSRAEAQAYLDDEGARWAHRHGYGRVPEGLVLPTPSLIDRARDVVDRVLGR